MFRAVHSFRYVRNTTKALEYFIRNKKILSESFQTSRILKNILLDAIRNIIARNYRQNDVQMSFLIPEKKEATFCQSYDYLLICRLCSLCKGFTLQSRWLYSIKRGCPLRLTSRSMGQATKRAIVARDKTDPGTVKFDLTIGHCIHESMNTISRKLEPLYLYQRFFSFFCSYIQLLALKKRTLFHD